MRISARCDYACKAILELVLNWPGEEPLQIHTISERQNIPIKYLVQILIQLKRLGLVESIRGKDGGYVLSKPPNKITLGEVMREIGGPLLPSTNSVTKKGSVFSGIWKEVEEAMANVIDRLSFEDIVNKAKNNKGVVSYQI